MCEQVLESFNSALGSPDANFSTPSASWAHFIGSLRTGDRKSAMSCLDPEWRGRIEEEFKAMSETQLREFANSLTDFRLTAVSMQDYQQATVKRPDGKIGFVMFVRSEAGWKIDSF